MNLSGGILYNPVIPSIDNLIEWVIKLYLQQNQNRTHRSKVLEDFFIANINEDTLARLYPANIDYLLMVGYLLIMLDRTDAVEKYQMVQKVLLKIKDRQEQDFFKNNKHKLNVCCRRASCT